MDSTLSHLKGLGERVETANPVASIGSGGTYVRGPAELTRYENKRLAFQEFWFWRNQLSALTTAQYHDV